MLIYGKTSANAVAILSYLAALGGRGAGSAEIARARELSRALTAKLLTQLAAAGLVTGRPGPGGGYTLARSACEICLLDVASLFEQTDPPPHCPFGRHWCGSHEPCPMHDSVECLVRQMREFLQTTTFEIFEKRGGNSKKAFSGAIANAGSLMRGVVRMAAYAALAALLVLTVGRSIAQEAPEKDAAAAKFMVSCAGCHSLDGKQLNGPPLNAAMGWPDPELSAAVKKMEAKAGPLPDPVVAELVAFLKSPDARERLAAEQSRMAAQFAAKMAPADAAAGAGLFWGRQTFRNDGLACAACHAVDGNGGTLGPALDGIYEKSGGELPLVSAIEGAKFPIMEPHYKRHPVTKQEAMHLAAWLKKFPAGKSGLSSGPSFAAVGAGAGGLLLLGMFGLLQVQRATRRRDVRLQRRRK